MNYHVIDRVGSYLSLTCALHCMLTPLLLLVPSFSGMAWVLHGSMECIFIFTTLATGISSLCFGFGKHQEIRVMILFVAAGLLIWLGHSGYLELFKRPVVITGSLILACSHLINSHLCRTCEVCEDRSS